ncbi:MAG: SHOCT domain-containing protein [Proteobacteria bacterium]|nr:SHOCT domain-containing protein [Pseudomonadota bacterium]
MTGGSPIVGRHGLTSYSVADELMKWNELRETGVVTEEEFGEARARLLKRDTSIDV